MADITFHRFPAGICLVTPTPRTFSLGRAYGPRPSPGKFLHAAVPRGMPGISTCLHRVVSVAYPHLYPYLLT
eukprot:8827689-Pyramimonas_sp.AAC.1